MQPQDLHKLMEAVRHTGHAIHWQFNSIVGECGVKGLHVRYLAILHHEGPMTAKALTEALKIDKGHTSRVLSELTALGLIEKGEGSRGVPVALTPAGVEIAERMGENLRQLEELTASQISEQELEVFLQVAAKLEAVFRSQTKE